MKTKKLIRNALAVLTIVFMSAVLCGAGCSNAADSPSSGGGSTSNGGSTSLNAIERQIAGGSIKDGSDIYKFFANKRGEKSGGSANMRSARAAGGVGFSWSADSEGKVTITMDDSSTAPVFKFTVTNGSIGLTVTKTGSNTPLTFTSPAPTSLDAAAILKQYPVWYEVDIKMNTFGGVGKHRFENGKVLFLDGQGREANYTTSGSSVIITATDDTQSMTIDFSTMLVDCDKLPAADKNGGAVTHNKAGCKMVHFGDNSFGESVYWHSNEITITPSSN